MKNFHVPLPEGSYAELRAEAERLQVPATMLAREAINSWLRLQTRKAMRACTFRSAQQGFRWGIDYQWRSFGRVLLT